MNYNKKRFFFSTHIKTSKVKGLEKLKIERKIENIERMVIEKLERINEREIEIEKKDLQEK